MSRTHRSSPSRHLPDRRAALAIPSAGAVAALVALAGPASAEPVNRNTETTTITCSDGATFTATDLDLFTGAQEWPRWVAHDLDSTAVFVPTHFGDVHIEVTSLADGSLILSEERSFDVAKGSAGDAVGDVLDCTASFSSPEEIPGFGEVLVSGSFDIQGYLTPRRS